VRVLLTGAAGFLGSHLAERFLEDGHEVVGLDNFITGSRDNIEHLSSYPRFSLVEHDISIPYFPEGGLDGLLHFASPASPVDYLEFPIQTLKVGSLGTHNALGIAKAKGARMLLASTSEVYGDPLIHPQPETYWGNVNPVGLRGVYDEAKRFAEAMTMAYHRYHGVDTRIVRIFNSIMADETVLLFNDEESHVEEVERYFDSRTCESPVVHRRMRVPAFDPETLRVELREADALIKHPSLGKDAYQVRTRYGRHVRVTGDHSVFRRGADGLPEAVPVRRLDVGDYVAIPGRLPVVERDRPSVDLADFLIGQAGDDEALWDWALTGAGVREILDEWRDEIFGHLMESPRFDGSARKRNTVGCSWRAWKKDDTMPLPVAARLLRRHGVCWPNRVRIRTYGGGRSVAIPARVHVTDELLWLLGLFVAEGCHVDTGGTYRILLSSDLGFLERAARILQRSFGVMPRLVESIAEAAVSAVADDGPARRAVPGASAEGEATAGPIPVRRAPSLYVDGRALLTLFRDVFRVTGYSSEIRIPAWIFQLPLSRLKHFLEGYREGDGTHTDHPRRRELAFNTASEGLATDLTYLLLRFGIVASVGSYATTFRQRYGEREFPFWRVTVCEVSDFDILTWSEGVTQTLNATRTGDLVWAKVDAVEQVEPTEYVYDFSVPGAENFLAGNGVFAHNTYGPSMRPGDGRVVSNFIVQALRGDPLTIYGDGSQTRSFCYVDDEVDGIYRLFHSDRIDPVNIGNPTEFTIRELADIVLAETGSSSPVQALALPVDDPKVRQPDITLARTLLGWEPKVDLREGIRLTIPYFREALQRRDVPARTI
jgi:nucleoside-diphosphate-sugar epimerase/intein/homing endonuclease